MSCFAQVDHALNALDRIREDRKLFADMNALEQRRAMAYYLKDHPGALMPALNDWLEPSALMRAWQAADTARVWQLIDRALAKGLGDAIDTECVA